MSNILTAIPAGLDPADVFAAFKTYWNGTEWADISADKVRYYLQNYSKTPLPVDLSNEEMGKEYFRKVQHELIGGYMKHIDTVNFARVSGVTLGQIFGIADITGKQAYSGFYEFIRKNRLSHPTEQVPKTQEAMLAGLPKEMIALLMEAAKQTGAKLAIPTAPVVETQVAPTAPVDVKAYLDAYLANLSVAKEPAQETVADVVVSTVTEKKTGKGKKKK